MDFVEEKKTSFMLSMASWRTFFYKITERHFLCYDMLKVRIKSPILFLETEEAKD